MPAKPAPLAPSPPSHDIGLVADSSTQRQIATRTPSSKAQDSRAPGTGSSAPATEPIAVASAPPSRAPLPTKQPTKANTSAKTTTAGAAPLPRLSAPLVDKMAMAAVISPSPTAEAPKISMTSKEWVIPPRPKPGRKPATDTPPTKRKAQNRAAQRAFRERRAARVGELEELLDEQKDVHQQEAVKLKEKVHSLELDLQSFRSRCALLENMLDRERQERIRAETQAETFKRRYGDDFFRPHRLSGPRISHSQPHSPVHDQSRHSLSDGRNEHASQGRNLSISQIITPPDSMDISSNNPEADAAITCGDCSPNGRCACAEEVLASASAGCGKCGFGTECQCLSDMTHNMEAGQDLKRAVSPSSGSSNRKRHRSDGDAQLITETDFTAMFSRTPTSSNTPYDQLPSETQIPSGDSMAFKESCGFCKDGTYCVCAEDAAAMATPAMTPTESTQPLSHQPQTPPPSEPDVISAPLAMEMTADGAVKLPRRIQGRKPGHKAAAAAAPASKSGCGTNGPGTCAQCQADPKSGLFCRLMSAKYSREQSPSGGGCCGGKGAGGGCCKSKKQSAPEKITLPSLPSLGLSCAEAYQTLSSHRNFSRAADDISSWLPKLKTTNQASRIAPGRQAVEVEAASIMSVLKEFDVRFGREC